MYRYICVYKYLYVYMYLFRERYTHIYIYSLWSWASKRFISGGHALTLSNATFQIQSLCQGTKVLKCAYGPPHLAKIDASLALQFAF